MTSSSLARPLVQRLLRPRTPAEIVITALIVATLLRIAVGASMGFGVDEAYTIANARQFSLSYFDHPPLYIWMVWATAALSGSENNLLLRLPFIGLFIGTTWMMFRLTARLFSERAGAWAAVGLNLSAVFTVSTAGWVLPDGPLMFFLLAATLCLTRLFFVTPPVRPYLWWSLAGLCIGLALLSKYHAVLYGGGVVLFLVSSPEQRRWLAHPAPYLGALIALAVALPVLLWNYQNDWVSFLFQGGRGSPGGALRPDHVLTNILGQAAWVLPWIWIPMVGRFGAGLAAGPNNGRVWLLCCLAFLPIAIFTIVPLWGSRGLPHWQAPGYLMLFPLLGVWAANGLARGDGRRRRWVKGSVGAMLAITALLGSHAATGWGRAVAPALLQKGDPSLEALDWRDLRTALSQRGLLDQSGLFAVTTSWIEAGKVGTAIGDRMPVLNLSQDPRNFAFQYDPADFVGRDAILIGKPRTMARAAADLAPYFNRLEALDPVQLTRGGRTELTLDLYYGHSLRKPYPLPYPKRALKDEPAGN